MPSPRRSPRLVPVIITIGASSLACTGVVYFDSDNGCCYSPCNACGHIYHDCPDTGPHADAECKAGPYWEDTGDTRSSGESAHSQESSSTHSPDSRDSKKPDSTSVDSRATESGPVDSHPSDSSPADSDSTGAGDSADSAASTSAQENEADLEPPVCDGTASALEP